MFFPENFFEYLARHLPTFIVVTKMHYKCSGKPFIIYPSRVYEDLMHLLVYRDHFTESILFLLMPVPNIGPFDTWRIVIEAH